VVWCGGGDVVAGVAGVCAACVSAVCATGSVGRVDGSRMGQVRYRGARVAAPPPLPHMLPRCSSRNAARLVWRRGT
jgi:hypothetical protein